MHLYELNPDNPCSMKGHMARQYGALVHEIWDGDAKTVAPIKLRVRLVFVHFLSLLTLFYPSGQ